MSRSSYDPARPYAGTRRTCAERTSINTAIGSFVTLAYAVLDESPDPVQITGAVLVLLGVMLVGLATHAALLSFYL